MSIEFKELINPLLQEFCRHSSDRDYAGQSYDTDATPSAPPTPTP